MSRAKRIVAQAVLSTTFLTAAALAIPTPALADTSNCRTGYFCIWEDADYDTNNNDASLVELYKYIPDYSLWKFSDTNISAENNASSFWNQSATGQPVYIYKDPYGDISAGSGRRWEVRASSGRNNLLTSFSPAGWNDVISSAYSRYYDPHQ